MTTTLSSKISTPKISTPILPCPPNDHRGPLEEAEMGKDSAHDHVE